jgi:uncharacterized membrane protein YkoI
MKTKNVLKATSGLLATVLLAVPLLVASAKPPKDRLPLAKAEAIATKTVQGRIESHELEKEKGKWVYSFDIRGNDKQIHEVLVDARTGEVVSETTETPAQEAEEKMKEKQEKK